MGETFKKTLYTIHKKIVNIVSSVCVWKNIICWNYIYLLALFVHLFITIIFLSLIIVINVLVTQLCLTPGDSMGCSPPWNSPGKNTWMRCHFLLQLMINSNSEKTNNNCSPGTYGLVVGRRRTSPYKTEKKISFFAPAPLKNSPAKLALAAS